MPEHFKVVFTMQGAIQVLGFSALNNLTKQYCFHLLLIKFFLK